MTRSSKLLSLLSAGALTLAACGGSDEAAEVPAATAADAPAEEAAEPATTEAPETTAIPVEATTAPESTEAPTTEAPATTEEPATTVAVTEEPTTTEAGASGDCLIGDWVITQAEMESYFAALSAGTGAGGAAPEFSVVGDTRLSFTETDYVYTANFTLGVKVAGQTGTGESTGQVSGTWAATDGIVVTQLGSSTLDVVISVAGMTINGSDIANGLLTSSPINDAPFSCDGPTLGFKTGDDTARHDVTLQPG